MLGATRVRLKDGREASIRPASPADAEAVTDLVNSVGAESRFVLRERATWSLEEERRTFASADGSRSVFFVCELAGRIVGLLNLARGAWKKDRHVAEFGMSCLREYRGIGVGSALLDRGVAWARALGVRKLTLEVFATNDPAIGLYRKAGFAEEARLRDQYIIDGQPVDGVLMSLWL